MPKYTIPTLPYNIALPNSGGRTAQPVQAPPSRLPQHLRAALTNGLCRIQSVADTPVASPGPWSDPDPLAAREERLIGQLVAQLEARTPGRHTPNQLVIQALQHYLNGDLPAGQPATPVKEPVGDTTTATTSAGLPAEIVETST